jgi:hypothetical protein
MGSTSLLDAELARVLGRQIGGQPANAENTGLKSKTRRRSRQRRTEAHLTFLTDRRGMRDRKDHETL